MRVTQSRSGGMLRTSFQMLRTSLRMLRTSLQMPVWIAVRQPPLRGDIFLTIHCKTWQYSPDVLFGPEYALSIYEAQ